ncbi:hypothetical protein FSARC_14517 [Fusarium sarcochroum]|uniref:Uncharacterized protein n=1 Tax=Fusarium sarcochroum TaxID=1208366 RepID=A0A8H4WPG7_9HYPO|nr:hypothetical protein FSARC_14517 [Fusarium sarcochroum]
MSTQTNQEPLQKTREQSISEFIERTKDIQKQNPDLDFKSTVIEPTMNLMYDIRENLNDKERKNHEALITLMLQNSGDPAKGEKYLWEAREYLKPYPDILKLFDDIYINKRPVPVMLGQLHEAMALKKSKPDKNSQE